MAHIIRVDDEVWNSLQQRGKPFVDSPNDVLRRALGLDSSPSSQPRDIAGGETTESQLPERQPVLKGEMSEVTRIRGPALAWFRKEVANSNSPLAGFLVKRNVQGRGFGFYKRNAVSSKYYQAGESYPGIPVWWLQISLARVAEPNDPFPFEFLLCQEVPNSVSNFWCLAVPFDQLNSEYNSGNLGTLGNNICLHLSAQNCTYRGYTVNIFDDVRLTMLSGHRPTPFAQFLLK